MYIRPRKKRRSNPWRVLFLLLVITAGIYFYVRIQQKEIESPFIPTPTPTLSAAFYRTKADGLYLEGDLDGAIAAYEQAVQLDPGNVSLTVPLVRLLAIQGWTNDTLAERAIEMGEQAVAQAPESAPAWAVLGMAYDWDGRVAEAVDACERAVELDPAYAEAYAYLAEAYVDDGQLTRAVEAARTALELDPRSVDANRANGLLMEVMGNWSAAVVSYRQALDIHPNLAYIYIDLGRNYLYLSDTGSAIESFRRATELDPQRADALDQLGWTYYAIQDYERAQTYLAQAIEVAPDYGPAYGHLGLAYYVRRNYEDAIPNLSKAIELAYREARRNARAFYVTVEPAQESFLYPSVDVVLAGEFSWADRDEIVLAADLEPQGGDQRWAAANGRVTMNTATGTYRLMLQGMPTLPAEQMYVGWFEELDGLDKLPLNTGPLSVGANSSFDAQFTAEPVDNPRIEHLYILGLCYFYMARCDQAYPLFEAALQIDPEETNALEGIRLCQEAEATPTTTP